MACPLPGPAGPGKDLASPLRESGVSVHVQKNDVNVFILALSSPAVFPVQNALPLDLLQGSPLGGSGSPLLFLV